MELIPTRDGDAELIEALVSYDNLFYAFLYAVNGAHLLGNTQELHTAIADFCRSSIARAKEELDGHRN